MKPLVKTVSAATAIAAVAFLLGGTIPKPAGAQQKGPVTPTLVRNIDEPGFNSFQDSQSILLTNFSGDATFQIPAGKVAVIEQVSATGLLQTGSVPQVFIRCRRQSDEVNHSMPLFSQGQVNGLTAWAGSQPFKCYATASPGTLNVHIQTGTFQTAQHTWSMAVSGYLVPE